ncbi:MAG: aminodeoxychorismate synthase component I [Chloroflexi bacterium]|nr:aminodeoxychorismate synthase component I [Chloroflexota bacterium]
MAQLPLIQEFTPPGDALQAFNLLHAEPHSFFLDSGMDPGKLGRFSFMGVEPFLVLHSRGPDITLRRAGKKERRQGHPFAVLKELMASCRLEAPDSPIPFWGGAVGYLSYDLGRFIERLPSRAQDDLALPESYLGFYDTVLAYDHLTGKAYLASTGLPEPPGSSRVDRAHRRLKEIQRKLAGRPRGQAGEPIPQARSSYLRSNFTHEGYLAAVARARDYIIAGDIFEVNLSQRFEADLPLPPWALYRRLRALNPAPFAAYLNYGDLTVVSASPERFLRLRGDRAQTRPIKGTRPRGQTPAEDEARAKALLASEKDRAENVMIVDLERNDLGRVCRYGTVKVTELCLLETFPTVFHLTSTVEGQLREGQAAFDLLRATFPGGSITGAPKVRAMEIIEELEPTRRSVYTGAIGYLGFGGDLDLNIAIRTFLVKGNRAYFQVGGAVVYDSDPEEEYQETLAKGRALVQSLGLNSESP